MMHSVSVIIPVYNSEAILPTLSGRLRTVLQSCTAAHEVVLVNDGSRDSSWDVIGTLALEYPGVRGVNLMRNYGQHNALLCGIRAARYPIIVTMDDDLQHPPEEIPKLLEQLTDGVDVVYGAPEKLQHGFWRNLASQVTKFVLQGAMGAETARHVTSFRVFRTELREAFASYRGAFVFIDVLLTWGTTRFLVVPVSHQPRQFGESNYTVRKLVVHAANMMTGFSALPLQIASLIGFVLTLFGVMVLVYVLVSYWVRGTIVPGFPFLASLIALFSGAQLFALGIIGEYLSRVHFRSMDKPAYLVREQVCAGNLRP